MATFYAVYDGKVLIPEGNLYFPIGKRLELTVKVVGEEETKEGLAFDIHPLTGLPVFRCSPGTKMINPEDIKRAEEEDDAERYRRSFDLARKRKPEDLQ